MRWSRHLCWAQRTGSACSATQLLLRRAVWHAQRCLTPRARQALSHTFTIDNLVSCRMDLISLLSIVVNIGCQISGLFHCFCCIEANENPLLLKPHHLGKCDFRPNHIHSHTPRLILECMSLDSLMNLYVSNILCFYLPAGGVAFP